MGAWRGLSAHTHESLTRSTPQSSMRRSALPCAGRGAFGRSQIADYELVRPWRLVRIGSRKSSGSGRSPAVPVIRHHRLRVGAGLHLGGWVGGWWPWTNGVKLDFHRCKIARVARPGQQVVAGDRLADRIGIGVLARVFPPELVDRVVDEAGVREQRTRTLPARVVVYYLLAMVLFFNSSYTEVWNKLVAGLDWARRFRVRMSLGMQPTVAAVTYARQRLGWQVMAA